MKLRLLAFATAAEAVGAGERELRMPDGSTVADLRQRLSVEFPDLGPLWGRLAVAVNGDLATPDTPLGDGAEVALLPPVSGGRQAGSDRVHRQRSGGAASG